MAVLCPKCMKEFDVTLFSFRNFVLCRCGAIVFLNKHIRAVGLKESLRNPYLSQPYSDLAGRSTVTVMEVKGNV